MEEQRGSLDRLFGKRRSGRTTRMLRAAVWQAEAGRQVIVYAHNAMYARQLAGRAAGMWGVKGGGVLSVGRCGLLVPVRTPAGHGCIQFTTPEMLPLDWGTALPLGQRMEDVFIDHHVLEAHLGATVRACHLFDEEEEME